MKPTLQNFTYSSLIASAMTVASWGMGASASESIAWSVLVVMIALWYRTKDSVFRTIAAPVLIIACAGYSFPKVFLDPKAIETLGYLPPAVVVTSIVATAFALARLHTYRKAVD